MIPYFREIMPTGHYLEEHLEDVPWEEVLALIITTKNPKRRGSVYQISDGKVYIVFRVREQIAYVINAKRKRK